MKLTTCSAGALASCLAAALLFSPIPLVAQTITNPGFEANTFTVFPGYIDASPTFTPNGPITGWTGTPVSRTGLNPSGSSPFADNGVIPEGLNVAFVQAGASGVASLQTTVTGLQINTKYNVSFRVNARAGQSAVLRFSVDGTPAGEDAEVTAVGGTNLYKYAAFEFTATAEQHTIAIANMRTAGDHTLTVDDVKIAPSSNAWSVAPWTGDADSGIDSSYVYTHSYNFGTNNGVTINGVRFLGRETGTPGRFALTGLGTTHGGGTNHVTGNSAGLAGPFRYDGQPSIKLENLKPSTQYVFTVYGVSWDGNPATEYRSATFSSNASANEQRLTVSLNKYGLGKPAGQGQGYGLLVHYAYTTDALGSPVTIFYPALGGGGFHTSGFSNREAVASTPAPAFTTAAWNDDASSGVLPTHHYTHALNFGTAASVNVNGVVFTGTPGANPAAPGYTSALPNVFNNDTNNEISSPSAALSRDFAHAGFPGAHNFSGLTPGKAYVFTIYSTGFEAPGVRYNTFFGNREDAPVVIDQSEFGNNKGIRIEYRYTAKADGTAKIFHSAYTHNTSIHVCAISNREADPTTGVAPLITLQPAGSIIATGSNYTLRVGAIGSATLSYQWKRGTTVVGTDSPVLDLSNVTAGDTGKYTVTVSNGVNSVASQTVTLLVLDHVPGIFGTGLDENGEILANGIIDPHYTLTANPHDGTKFDTYVQTNVPGAWLANSATSKWIGPLANTASANGSLDAGEGFGTYVYRTHIDLTGRDLATVRILGRWASDNNGLAIRVNGVATGISNLNPTGAAFSTLEPFVIDTGNAPGLIAGINNIDFVVNNAGDGLTGLRVDTLRAVVIPAAGALPVVIVQPKGGTVIRNGNLTLKVSAIGSGPLGYQWYKNGDPISGQTGTSLNLVGTSAAINGNYKVIVTNAAGDAESTTVPVMVANAAPVANNDGPLVTDENVPLELSVEFDLLSNDTDGNTDTLTLTNYNATSVNGGTIVAGGSPGTLVYTPPVDWPITGEANDTFTYTISDGWGGTATGTVTIAVVSGASVPPTQMTLAVDLNGNNVTGTFTGTPGATYILQRSTTLLADSWTNVDTKVAEGSGVVNLVDNDPPDGRAFYRISYEE
ncbi:cadherin-like domain-containing protein [Luteolibacter arcticus]|uniref:Cadherin-like domain-containing protein n=1 Tax=Luteolibacter arcticus TaxID=1581411 RepID=A0ABT3GGN2_9BACT|nr:cadherin-like domain-containing protein [Luteolibacter arcticus]MCW1922428.1 cadherin-like domain-containing protein [Luteolibacter arcticus]